ncbi:MAG: hypothetical protein RAK25_03515, partial [TACK group archaeon]|nr:hypothetical protein [TACK group archaeon]
MRKKISAENKMEELLEFIRSKGSVSEDDAIAFCKQKFGVSPQTTYRYLTTLERAGLIRVKPDEITPWRREAKKTVNSNPLSLFCRGSPGLLLIFNCDVSYIPMHGRFTSLGNRRGRSPCRPHA